MPKCPKCGASFGEDKETPKPMKEEQGKMSEKMSSMFSKRKPLPKMPDKKKWVPKRNELGVIVNKRKQDEISY